MKRILHYFFTGMLSVTIGFCSLTVHAQTRNNLTRSHNESVNIYGTFQPKIGEAIKLSFKPELFTPHFRKSVFDIEPSVSTLPTTITLKPIKPVSIRVGKRQHIYENYFAAGIGSRISPYAEFFHSAGKRNSYQLNFHLYHLSTFKNIKDYLPSPTTATLAALSFEKYFRYHTFTVGAAYRLNTNRYYGVKLSDYPSGTTFDLNNPALKQAYNLAKFGIGLKSHYKNNEKLAHALSLNSYYYFDKHGTSELNANLFLDVHKAFSVSDILDYQMVGLEGVASFYRQADTLNTGANDLYFRAMPYFNFKYDFVAFKVGLDFEVQNADSTKFHFYPYLHATLNLVPEVVSIFAGIDGGLQKNSFRKLSEKNPFLSSIPGTFLWTNNKINLFAGIKGNVAGRFGFYLKYRFQKFTHKAFYDYLSFGLRSMLPPVPWYKNEFIISYQSGVLHHFEAGLNYHEGENFKIWLTGIFDSYQLENSAIAYFKPKIKVNFGASYLINDKIEPHLELWYVGEREGSVKNSGGPSLPAVTLAPYLDLNLNIRYAITHQLSVFLEGTNLLNKKYMLFTNYPVSGIQVMGGLTYRF